MENEKDGVAEQESKMGRPPSVTEERRRIMIGISIRADLNKRLVEESTKLDVSKSRLVERFVRKGLGVW